MHFLQIWRYPEISDYELNRQMLFKYYQVFKERASNPFAHQFVSQMPPANVGKQCMDSCIHVGDPAGSPGFELTHCCHWSSELVDERFFLSLCHPAFQIDT